MWSVRVWRMSCIALQAPHCLLLTHFPPFSTQLHTPLAPQRSFTIMDDFEDTGDMTLPKGDARDVWLTRIPPWLYEFVSNWDDLAEGSDNDEIQIGEVAAFMTTSGVDRSKPMRVFLNDRARKKQLPTAFQLDPTPSSDTLLQNTYLFTQKNLPGHKEQNGGYGQWNRGIRRPNAVQDPGARVTKSKFRRSVPQQTALVGHTSRQYNAQALATREFMEFNQRRIKQAVQGSHDYINITNDRVSDMTNDSSLKGQFQKFIKPTNKSNKQQNKATRISRSELIDILHSCFDDYEYWAMKSLKAKTKQPENFLRETLQELAVLVKSGPYASMWKRMDMFDKTRDTTMRNQGQADIKAEDSEEEMEDVV